MPDANQYSAVASRSVALTLILSFLLNALSEYGFQDSLRTAIPTIAIAIHATVIGRRRSNP